MTVKRYLKRMDASMEDKMRVVSAIPESAELVLDVGCAAGTVTANMANLRPNTHFHGIDVELPLVGMAQSGINIENVGFSHNWLSDLHMYSTKYDAITFMSVLHEFYSHGQGLTSVIKALCDAYELLKPGGVIVIRDMLRPDNKSEMGDRLELIGKVESQRKYDKARYSYDDKWGFYNGGISHINDFLLHTLYLDNWENEVQEHYMFWTGEDYLKFFRYVLGMEVSGSEYYLLDYIAERWKKELWVNQMEMSQLYSTGIIAVRK